METFYFPRNYSLVASFVVRVCDQKKLQLAAAAVVKFARICWCVRAIAVLLEGKRGSLCSTEEKGA